tara:strand:+ start:2879 stop:3739 length:861 start_codon:yes stop_codon:yes gene_type:complete
MSLINTIKEHNEYKPIIIVGQAVTEKLNKALTFVSNNPIIKYGNEYDITDNYSIPIEVGIIIREVNYKPNTDLIRKTILEYKGQVVLLSDNQKDVPKSIFNLCKLKRATKKIHVEYLKEIAPRASPPKKYDIDIYPMVGEYLKNADRNEIAEMLKDNKPSDTQFLSWLTPNMHPNKLAYIDFAVKRKLSNDYFYEMLAYVHDGRMYRKLVMPTRNSYSVVPKICRKLKLKKSDAYLLKSLLQDKEFLEYAKTKLDNTECKILGIGNKTRKKRYAPIQPKPSLGAWL